MTAGVLAARPVSGAHSRCCGCPALCCKRSQFTPIPVWHGPGYLSFGFRFGDICYIRQEPNRPALVCSHSVACLVFRTVFRRLLGARYSVACLLYCILLLASCTVFPCLHLATLSASNNRSTAPTRQATGYTPRELSTRPWFRCVSGLSRPHCTVTCLLLSSDVSEIPEATYPLLENCDLLIIVSTNHGTPWEP